MVWPGRMAPLGLGVLDHRPRDAVLDRARGVVALELGPDADARLGRDPLQLDQRRVADGLDDVAVPAAAGTRVEVRRRHRFRKCSTGQGAPTGRFVRSGGDGGQGRRGIRARRCRWCLAASLGSTYSDPASERAPDAPSAPRPPPARIGLALSRRLAAPWPDAQRPSGHVPDPLRAGDAGTYGDGTIGLAMLQTGARDRDRRLVRAGLERGERRDPLVGVPLQHPPLSGLDGRRRLRARPAPAGPPAGRPSRRCAAGRIGCDSSRARGCGALRTRTRCWPARSECSKPSAPGFSPAVEGSIFAPAARARAEQLVNRTIPSMASGRRAFVLSDPPQNPIAYHALSYGMYARAVALLGSRASASNARHAAAAREGNLTHHGARRQHGVLGALPGAGLDAVGGGLRARGDRPAARDRRRPPTAGTTRSRRARWVACGYGVGPRGGHTIPALGQDQRAGLSALDPYAHTPEYAGLSLVFLNWAIPLLPRGQAGETTAADRSTTAVLSGGSGRFATVRRGASGSPLAREPATSATTSARSRLNGGRRTAGAT